MGSNYRPRAGRVYVKKGGAGDRIVVPKPVARRRGRRPQDERNAHWLARWESEEFQALFWVNPDDPDAERVSENDKHRQLFVMEWEENPGEWPNYPEDPKRPGGPLENMINGGADIVRKGLQMARKKRA